LTVKVQFGANMVKHVPSRDGHSYLTYKAATLKETASPKTFNASTKRCQLKAKHNPFTEVTRHSLLLLNTLNCCDCSSFL